MSFARANSIGWALYEVLTSAQMNALDIDHTKAIDGVAGGTYAPTSPITLTTGAIRLAPEIGTVEYQAGAYPDLTTRTVERNHPVDILCDNGDQYLISSFSLTIPDWVYGTIAFEGNVRQAYIDTGAGPDIPWYMARFVPAVPYGTITGLDLYLQGASGHVGMPAVRPQFKFMSANLGGYSVIATQADTSASTGTYQAVHPISMSGLTETLFPSANKSYMIMIEGEGGTNGLSGLRIFLLKIDYLVDQVHP